MKVIAYNNILGGTYEYPLEDDEIIIGREVSDPQAEFYPGIPIQSRLVSQKHVVLRQKQGDWHIEHCGTNPTIINDDVLEFGEERKIELTDEIQMGEYSIRLVDDARKVESDLDADQYEKIMRLESAVHGKLLDLMDLRRSSKQLDLADEGTREKIKEYLEKLVEQTLKQIDAKVKAELFRQAVYRRLSWEITTAGADQDLIHRYREFEQPFFENMLGDISRRMFAELGIQLDPRKMREESDALDTRFTEIFKSHELDFSEGLLEYMCGMYFKLNILNLIFGLGPLQDLLDTPSITEIMVVSRDRIFVEKFGVVEDSRRAFYNDALLLAVIERIVAPVGRRIDKSTPLVDARLADGSRVNAIIPPLALKGPCLTIRKFSKSPVTIDNLVEFGALNEKMRAFLKACVDNHLNIIVSGGTGSGKTTMLNSLSAFISPSERIVTIEDTAELQMMQDHVVTLETRPPNMEGKGEITMRDLLKNALRMRPDRIVVGECRGGETLDMLQAMNTGHDGSMTTGHANTPQDMMKRLETMVLTGTNMPVDAIRNQIAGAVHLVVQLNRFSSGQRRVTHISEVVDIDEKTGEVIVEDIIRYFGNGDPGNERHSHTGYIPTFMGEMIKKGNIDLAALF